MATDNSGDLSAFHQFVGAQLQAGTDLSPQEVFDRWCAMHPSEEEMEGIEAMVQEALDDLAAGEKGIPIDDVFAEMEAKYGLKPSSKSP